MSERIKCFMIEPVLSEREDRPWRRLDNGEVRDDCDAFGPGAMWYAPWLSAFGSVHFQALPEEIRKRGNLIVKVPHGHWNIDSKSSNGTGWTRTGEPPVVTARPSIGIPGAQGQQWIYHGWLTDGELIPC
jgi:hypothetical protein